MIPLMKPLAALVLFSASLFAQATLSQKCSDAVVVPGNALDCTLELAGGNNMPGALQFTLGVPVGDLPTVTPAGTALAAGKSIFCSPTFSTCLVFGINTTTIADGIVATVSYFVPKKHRGTDVFTLSGTLGSTINGTAVPISPGPPVSVDVSQHRRRHLKKKHPGRANG